MIKIDTNIYIKKYNTYYIQTKFIAILFLKLFILIQMY